MICVLWFRVPAKQPSFNHHAKIVAQCAFPLYFIYFTWDAFGWQSWQGFCITQKGFKNDLATHANLLDIIFQRHSFPNCPKIHHIVTCRFIFLHVQTSYCKLLAKAAALHSMKLQWFSLNSNCQTHCTIWFELIRCVSVHIWVGK